MEKLIRADELLNMLNSIVSDHTSEGKFPSGFGIYDAIKLVESAPAIMPPNDLFSFDVVDTRTGEYPDWERIVLEEEWAEGLVYCDIDGVAIHEDGRLILLDDCGNCVSCPSDRFLVRFDEQ